MALKRKWWPDRSSFPATLPKNCDLRSAREMDLYWFERYRRGLARNWKTLRAYNRLRNQGFM